LATFKLPIKGVSLGTHLFKYHLNSDFFNEIESTEVRHCSVDVNFSANYESDGTFELDFDFKGELVIPCDRCLDDLTLPVETTYHLTVKQGEAYDDSRDEVLIVPADDRELDLAPIIRDTVLLTIPLKHVHNDGECNEEMLNKLNEHAAIEITPTDKKEDNNPGSDPRWEALRKLKDNN
jgi:uncharacterized metal-binding protein YceD (DUF177 family)